MSSQTSGGICERVQRWWWRIASRVQRRMGPLFAALHHHAWPIIGVLAVADVVLATWSFSRRSLPDGQPPTFWDALYASLQLFALGSGAISGHVDWELNVARFLALVVTAGAALQVLAVLFYDRLQLTLLRLFGHDHVIVCGLGRKGATLVKELRQNDEWVVVIENDPQNPGLDYCREDGAAVLIGSATDRRTLRRACVHRAKALVAVMDGDGANVETAVLARDLNGTRRRGSLRCIIHVVDRGLHQILRQTEMANREDDPFELEFFNVYEMCAQEMLRDALRMPTEPPPHLLIVGFGQLGETLVVQAAQHWKGIHTACKLPITVVDRRAEAKEAALARQYPEVSTVCDLHFRQLDVRDPSFNGGTFLADAGQAPVTAAYVCLGDDTLGICAGLTLNQCLRPRPPRILVRMTERIGVAKALRPQRTAPGFVDGVEAVGLLELTCTADLILGKPMPQGESAVRPSA